MPGSCWPRGKKSSFLSSGKAAVSEHTLSWYTQHPPALSGPCPIQTASQELLLSRACFGEGVGGRADRALPLSQPSPAFPHHSVATSPHSVRGGGSSVAPRCALAGQRDPWGIALTHSPPCGHPPAAGEKETPACPSCGGSCPVPPSQTLHQRLAPVPAHTALAEEP